MTGYLKFFKLKFDELIPTIANPDKFNRQTLQAKVAYLKQLKIFCKAFKPDNEILVFSAFSGLSDSLEICITKPLCQMTSDEMKLAKSYCELALLFCQRF